MLSRQLAFTPEFELAALPAAPAVFVLRGEGKSEPYVSKTANLRRRLIRLLGPAEERTRRLNLRASTRFVEFTLTGSDFESGFLLYQLLLDLFPRTYSRRLRLRPAPLVRLHLNNPYPRASVTTRLGKSGGADLYYGPFPSRVAAEKFVNDSLDFFKLRRCVENLAPDPAFPGCVYSEMRMCLAPCFRGCTDDEYRAEVSRVTDFFDSAGESLARELERQRDQASVSLQFEDAASLHVRREKLQPVLAQLPELVHRVDRFHAVLVQRSPEPGCVSLFRVDQGAISGPFTFLVQPRVEHAAKSQSMESRLAEALTSWPASPLLPPARAVEHLAILKRWFYRSARGGEIFFAGPKDELPLRRIVRGIGRVFRGERAAGEADQATGTLAPTQLTDL
jgi:excinuclease ABC subunit C